MSIQPYNDVEGMRIAIEMEKRGLDLYQRALRVTHDDGVARILHLLIADEQKHVALFQQRLSALQSETPCAENYSVEASAFLAAIASDVAFPGGLMSLAYGDGLEDPLAVIMFSIHAEKDAILFYDEILRITEDEETKRTFEQIVKEERIHLMELQRHQIALEALK